MSEEITQKIRHIRPPDHELIRTARARLGQAIAALGVAGKAVDYAHKLCTEALNELPEVDQ